MASFNSVNLAFTPTQEQAFSCQGHWYLLCGQIEGTVGLHSALKAAWALGDPLFLWHP